MMKNKTNIDLNMDDLTNIMNQMPKEMLPEMLCKLAIISLNKGVWKCGGLSNAMERVEQKFWNDYERNRQIRHLLKNVA